MNRFVAAEQFSSGKCPLQCKYCYVPKTSLMTSLHEEIVKKLESKSCFDSLEKVYGKNIEYFELWGTEPTLTLSKIPLSGLLNRFPKLKEMGFSTNLMTSPKILSTFILNLDRECTMLKRQIRFKPQISLDGPAFITDINRAKGAAERIPKNFIQIIETLNKHKLKSIEVEFRMKSTLTMENIEFLNDKTTKIKEYFDYFNKIEEAFKKTNKDKGIQFNNSCAPSMCVPGKYTTADGKKLAVFFRHLRKMNYPNTYLFRLNRLFKFQDELSNKPRMFTCSGGDSNLGLGIKNDIHLCHRTFFLNYPEYIKSILSQDIDNWDVSLFEQAKINYINEKFIVDANDEKEKARFFYIMRNYHDFWRFRIGHVVTMLKELVLAKQASKCYLNKELATLFAIFANTGLSCPMENILNTGALYFTPVSVLRLFANGAFEELVRHKYELSKRK